MPTGDVDPPLIRVLLGSDTEVVGFTQPGRPFRVGWEGGERWMWGPLEARPGFTRTWQVGAWSEERWAGEAVERLRAGLPGEAEVTTEAGEDGLIRVRVRWDVPLAEARTRLTALGFEEALPLRGSGTVTLEDGTGAEVRAPWFRVVPNGPWPTRVAVGPREGRRYRGRFVVRADGERVLVIDELNLESYLRGVVPAEMGPLAFPQLEALKAQAVAARTYAVAHRGDHEDLGYDLCATPACQVYRGVDVEHRLTDRAVEETAGIIATFDGEPIDAMYTSTCGGHTEDASVLFSGRAQPYLKGVACAWDRPLELAGTGPATGWLDRTAFMARLAEAVLDLGPSPTPGGVLARVAELTGGAAPEAPPADDGAYLQGLVEAARLDAAARVLVGATGPVPPLLELADLVEVPLDPPTGAWDDGWHLAAALAALEIQGVVRHDTGEAVPRPEGVGIFPRRARASEPLEGPFALWERWDGGWRSVRTTTVLPGTLLERWRLGDRVLAVAVRRSRGDGEADRRSAWRSWVREKTWAELAERMGMPDLLRLEITRRAATGRVVGLAAVGRSGRRKEWEGFAVRRALGLPETFVAFQRVKTPEEGDVVRFIGRGWGHGVGLCQNGAYGLARAGMTYDRILRHYYTGIELELLEPAPGP